MSSVTGSAQVEAETLERRKDNSCSKTMWAGCHWWMAKVSSCPCSLGFGALVKGSGCQLPCCRGRLTQGPGQEYSSDQSEQCCTPSWHRTLGTQLQYLNTVGVQCHHPGPQGGHTVTGETRASGRSGCLILGSPDKRVLSRSATRIAPEALGCLGWVAVWVSLQQREL